MEVDISGKKYNHLIALNRELGYANRRDNYWRCKCECGKETVVKKYDLTHSIVKSCGCLSKKMTSETLKKHGDTGSRLYTVWDGMKRRCLDKKDKGFPRYGGRGITICDEWLGKHGYENFKSWAVKNGYDENAKRGVCTIDRIDNKGNYEPSNCRWVNQYVQANNRECVYKISYNGETHSFAEWSRIIGVSETALKDRVFRQGLTIQEAFIKNDRRKKFENEQTC